jgi:hypothetical protein
VLVAAIAARMMRRAAAVQPALEALLGLAVALLGLTVAAAAAGAGSPSPRNAGSACAAGCPHDPAGCPGDLCCSLNGELLPTGHCKCDAPWHGPRCELLGFKPATVPEGYGLQPQVSSWGGNALFDGEQWHLFVAAMTNNCSLSSWQTNSRIVHAVARTVAGPYTKKSVAVNTWAHNPVVVKLPDGAGYALMHIGTGSGSPNGGANCSSSSSSASGGGGGGGGSGGGGGGSGGGEGSTVHLSDSLSGPWSPLLNSTLGPCNNPSPWVHRNGTIYLVCSGGATGNGMWRAEHISGPWRLVTASLSAGGGVYGVYEDPYLFMDRNDYWHLLFHVYETGEPGMTCGNSTVSAHLFSLDGYEWHTTPVQPYGTQILLGDGTTMTVSTRERPKIHFDDNRRATHLFNGVSALPSCWTIDAPAANPNAEVRPAPQAADLLAPPAAPPPVFPPAAPGWQRFLDHCMSEQRCTSGCNCASHAFIRNFSQCGKQQPYPLNCYEDAQAACHADENCSSFAISSYLGKPT